MIKERLVDLFADSIRQNWAKPAVSDYLDNKTLTYGEVGTQVAKLHLLFKHLGVEKGDKISLIGKNGTDWCITYIATVTYGAIIVPILQDFPAPNVHHIVTHSDSKILFASDYIWKLLDANELPNITTVFNLDFDNLTCLYQKEETKIAETLSNLDAEFAQLYPNGYTANDVKYADVDNSEVVCISYTSGTTGFSKGVMLTSNNLAGNVMYGKETKLVKDAKVLSFLPLAHAYCCAFDFLAVFCEGSHTYYLGKTPAPPILMKALADVKPDMIFTVPLIIEKVYKKKILPTINKPIIKMLLGIPGINKVISKKIHFELKKAFGGRFREIIIGGAAFNPEVEAFFKKIRIKFCVGYGMTECGPLISKSPWKKFVLTSVGQILPSMEVKIQSNDPYNEVGEILVRGEHVMAGYYKNEEATNAVIDKDGWLHTGDMGFIDRNKNIYIRGRNKSMLLGPNGQNIYPEEIEAKLNNLDLIQESLVLQDKSNKLIALVYLDADAIRRGRISQKHIQRTLEHNRKVVNRQVGAYEQIAEIRIFDKEFEKTPKRSIKRFLYTDIID